MTEAPGAVTFRLIYRSRDRIPAAGRDAVLVSLFSGARANNQRQNITGALLLGDDWFVQILEGEEVAVRGLFDHIITDRRHDLVSLLDARPVTDRVFARWAMARVSRDGEPDIPIVDGVSAAIPGVTPEQEDMLDLMREAALGGSQTV